MMRVLAEQVLGFDVGGSKILARIGPWRERIASGRDCSPDRLVDIVVGSIARATAAGHCPMGIGIGFPGLVADGGSGVRSSVILDGWSDVPLAALLRQRTGLPARIENDVNCWALGELAKRPDATSFLLLTVGTGVGGAIVLNRRLWRGRSGLAGEIGHASVDEDGILCLCGQKGCVGPLVGGEALCAELAINSHLLKERIRSRDPVVAAAIRWRAEALGSVVANALNLLDPGLVVIAGSLAPAFLPGVKLKAGNAFAEIVANTRVELSCAMPDGAAVGATHLLDGEQA
ncbi:ROK family protein [Sphingomonas baiyangensis]|uniref:ROK family protein n=1 Tax=Sphingomonas baiyangensis TaxID=2572576 RepID=A0A4U1L1W3_9SPHN|nr:ROK family protein [Sphingomonas baiyangensis]TKD50153.1 ROK family protein [Sphingomonas baiyangensis]